MSTDYEPPEAMRLTDVKPASGYDQGVCSSGPSADNCNNPGSDAGLVYCSKNGPSY